MAQGRVPGRVILVLALFACSGEPPSQDPAPTPPTGQVVVESEGVDADLAASQAFWATRAPVERPLTQTVSKPVLGSMSAASCGACHQEIYEEWRVSTHAHAWTDLQFQAEMKKSDNRWLCLNCHTPDLTQQAYWPRGLVDNDVERPILTPNPTYDAALRDEGITCVACHLRDGVIHGPGLGGDAPHPVAADPDYRSGALCIRCHQAELEYPGKTFVCTFQTGEEVEAGPYTETCVACHMPTITRPAAIGGPPRTVARHWWRGAGIPKVAGVHPPREARPPGLGLAASVQAGQLQLRLENAGAAHMLPTGDPERWVQVDVHFEGSDATWSTRIGQTWEWHPKPKKVADNRLAPKEVRMESIPVPAGATQATVVASSHRMSVKNATYHHLNGRYPLSVETHRLVVDLER